MVDEDRARVPEEVSSQGSGLDSSCSQHSHLYIILGSIRETPHRGPFLTLLLAFLTGTLLRGSLFIGVPLILKP